MELNEIESSSLKNQIFWSFWIYAHIHLHSQILFYILRSEISQKFRKKFAKNSQKWRKNRQKRDIEFEYLRLSAWPLVVTYKKVVTSSQVQWPDGDLKYAKTFIWKMI